MSSWQNGTSCFSSVWVFWPCLSTAALLVSLIIIFNELFLMLFPSAGNSINASFHISTSRVQRDPSHEYTPHNTHTHWSTAQTAFLSQGQIIWCVFWNYAQSNVSSPGESGAVCFSKVSGTCCLSAGKMGIKCHQVGHCVCSKQFKKRIWNALWAVRGDYKFSLGLY